MDGRPEVYKQRDWLPTRRSVVWACGICQVMDLQTAFAGDRNGGWSPRMSLTLPLFINTARGLTPILR